MYCQAFPGEGIYVTSQPSNVEYNKAIKKFWGASPDKGKNLRYGGKFKYLCTPCTRKMLPTFYQIDRTGYGH
jgi:hypothetical protein